MFGLLFCFCVGCWFGVVFGVVVVCVWLGFVVCVLDDVGLGDVWWFCVFFFGFVCRRNSCCYSCVGWGLIVWWFVVCFLVVCGYGWLVVGCCFMLLGVFVVKCVLVCWEGCLVCWGWESWCCWGMCWVVLCVCICCCLGVCLGCLCGDGWVFWWLGCWLGVGGCFSVCLGICSWWCWGYLFWFVLVFLVMGGCWLDWWWLGSWLVWVVVLGSVCVFGVGCCCWMVVSVWWVGVWVVICWCCCVLLVWCVGCWRFCWDWKIEGCCLVVGKRCYWVLGLMYLLWIFFWCYVFFWVFGLGMENWLCRYGSINCVLDEYFVWKERLW